MNQEVVSLIQILACSLHNKPQGCRGNEGRLVVVAQHPKILKNTSHVARVYCPIIARPVKVSASGAFFLEIILTFLSYITYRALASPMSGVSALKLGSSTAVWFSKA